MPTYAQQTPAPPTETIKTAASHTPEQQEVIDLANTKWDWMADKKVDSLEALFDDRAMFTHMGGTWGKTQELNTIKSGGIWYKKAFVYATDVRIFGNAAVMLEDMDLQAVVGSHLKSHQRLYGDRGFTASRAASGNQVNSRSRTCFGRSK